jgi:branched-subunit amino acid aminotransferase/4-amino-4-deoxychorismate lyase
MTIVLLDGQEVREFNWSEISESGFFSGSRVMTTILAEGACLVDFERHLERLNLQAEAMVLNCLPRHIVMEFEIGSLLQRLNNPKRARVRVLLFKDKMQQTRRLVTAEVLDEGESQSLQRDGVKLDTVLDRAWPRGSHIKTGIVGARAAGLERAKGLGFNDVLWLNSDGELAEATWSNVFLIGRTGDLVEIATPPESSGILAGVTRQRITDLLMSAKIPVTERVISEEEIPRFDEAFLTSSIRGIIPVTQIGRHRLQTLRPQAVFHHVLRLYNTWLSLEKINNSRPLDPAVRS